MKNCLKGSVRSFPKMNGAHGPLWIIIQETIFEPEIRMWILNFFKLFSSQLLINTTFFYKNTFLSFTFRRFSFRKKSNRLYKPIYGMARCLILGNRNILRAQSTQIFLYLTNNKYIGLCNICFAFISFAVQQ